MKTKETTYKDYYEYRVNQAVRQKDKATIFHYQALLDEDYEPPHWIPWFKNNREVHVYTNKYTKRWDR